MVTSHYEIDKLSVYAQAVFHLLELREAIELAPPEKKAEANDAFEAYFIKIATEAASNKKEHSPADAHQKICSTEALAKSMAAYSSPYALERFNSYERFNYKREPNGDIATRGIFSGEPMIVSESSPLQPYELEKRLCDIYQKGEGYIGRIANMDAASSREAMDGIAEIISYQCRVREITQTPPSWFEKDFSDAASTQKAWDACVLNLMNHKDEMHPSESLEEFKQQRLAASTDDLTQHKHCYGLYLPWSDSPIYVTYTCIAEQVEGEAPVAGVKTLAQAASPADSANRVYLYNTVGFDDILGTNFPVKLLYTQAFNAASKALPQDLEPKTGTITQLALSPLSGFPTWLEKQMSAAGDSLFTLSEQQKVKALSKGVLSEQGVGALAFLQHYISFDSPAADQQLRLNSPAPDFAEFDESKRPQARALLQELLSALATQYVYEAWQKTTPHTHVDPSIDLHASNGARLLHINANCNADEWERSAGVTANFGYLQGMPKIYTKLYEQRGFPDELAGTQVAQPIWEEYNQRREALRPESAVQAEESELQSTQRKSSSRERD